MEWTHKGYDPLYIQREVCLREEYQRGASCEIWMYRHFSCLPPSLPSPLPSHYPYLPLHICFLLFIPIPCSPSQFSLSHSLMPHQATYAWLMFMPLKLFPLDFNCQVVCQPNTKKQNSSRRETQILHLRFFTHSQRFHKVIPILFLKRIWRKRIKEEWFITKYVV